MVFGCLKVPPIFSFFLNAFMTATNKCNVTLYHLSIVYKPHIIIMGDSILPHHIYLITLDLS